MINIKSALEQVKQIKDPKVRYSFYLRYRLDLCNQDLLEPIIRNVIGHFNLDMKTWDQLITDSDLPSIKTYKHVYAYLKSLTMTQTDIAISNLKKKLNDHQRVCVE